MLHSFRDDARRRFIVTAVGNVSFAHVLTFVKSQLSQNAWHYAVLHDARRATTDLTSEDAEEIISWWSQGSMAHARGPVAMVAHDPGFLTTARAYAALVAGAGGRMAVFEDIDVASRWLDRETANEASRLAG